MASILTNTGLGIFTALLAASTNRFVAWGTGAGTAAAADTSLFTEAAEARESGAQSQETTTETDDTYQVVATMVSASDQTITNVGLFSALTAGDLFCKSDFAGVPLLTGESIQFTIKVEMS